MASFLVAPLALRVIIRSLDFRFMHRKKLSVILFALTSLSSLLVSCSFGPRQQKIISVYTGSTPTRCARYFDMEQSEFEGLLSEGWSIKSSQEITRVSEGGLSYVPSIRCSGRDIMLEK